jgi:hypothetical protein
MKSLFAIALCLLASCVWVRTAGQSSLVGEWRYADKTQSCHYAFKEDGTFTGEVTYRTRLVSKFRGRWAVRGDALFYTYLGDALGRIPAGATDRDKLLGIQKDSFLIEAADGSQRRYRRIP